MHHPVTFTRLGDFTATRRLLVLSAIAVGLGLAGTVVAAALLDLIALSTNLFFHHRFSFDAAWPVSHELGRWAILVPAAAVFPAMGAGFWPLVSMAGVLGGTMRTPLTAIVFAIELTHDFNMLLPLLVAVTIAYALTVLGVRRSILTEKVARRGYHLTREYAIDPPEIVFVREVMQPFDAPAAPVTHGGWVRERNGGF